MTLIIGIRLEFPKRGLDGESKALFNTIMLALKPGETPVVPLAREAPPYGIYAALVLFDTSFLVSMFVATFGMMLQPCLNRYLLHRSGSVIECLADLNGWRFDLFVKVLQVMVLIPLPLLLCGLWKWFC